FSTCEIHPISRKKNGKCYVFNINRDTLSISNFKNDKLHGKSYFFFDNHKLQLEVSYNEGTLDGVENRFYSNGNIQSKILYKNGKMLEIIEMRDSSGNTLDYGFLKEGNGFIRFFYPNGKIKDQGSMKKGVKDGWWIFHTNTGLLFDST